ncbi:MAG: 50S ribosomal protein L6 [Chloroflexi bacterium]|nr:50S ribosomal protein L6 [Chloroflexota bacterium]
MSRIGKMPVKIPTGVKVNIEGATVAITGPKGELKQTFDPNLEIKTHDGQIVVTPPDAPGYDALHGLTRALLNNMVQGVTDGYKRSLEIEGVGYRAELQGKSLVLAVGLSHQITVEPPAGITFTVDKSQRLFTIEGTDKQLVGELAAKIRLMRPPEPYKGKGIRYQGERLRRKAGKAGKVGAGAK